jgi:carboxyl-terminal processing protease
MKVAKKPNPIKSWKKLSLSVLVAVSVLPAWPAAASTTSERVDQVLELLSGSHLSGTSEEALGDAAIRAMVDALKDPYTEYMSKEDMTRFQNSLSRSYIGIGVEIGLDKGGIFIGNVFKGSPAEASGLQVDDYIVAVDGKELSGLSTGEVSVLIKGEEKSNVSLTVRRGDSSLNATVLRQDIQLPVLESGMFSDGVGYMRLYSFSDDADEQFSAALDDLKGRGNFRSLVLDLRNNSGGLLESAAHIAARFIPKGTVIHTRNRSGNDEPVEIQQGESLSVPVYVLVNGYSASASEVLAGALQDHKAAIIAGTRTYGKGSVQELHKFEDGASLKITIEEYYTPNGNPVNGIGIRPDLDVEGDINQLITVLRKAGVSDFRLEQNRSSLQVNGLKTDSSLPFFKEEGHIWVHSRVLAAMVGSEVRWIPEASEAVLTTGPAGKAPRFSEHIGNARFIEGRLYLDTAAFQAAYPEFSVLSEDDASRLLLRTGKGME